MKNLQPVLITLALSTMLAWATAISAADPVSADEEMYRQDVGGEWRHVVWSSVSTPELNFSIVRMETSGGAMHLLLLPEGDGPILTKEEDHEVDPDPKRGAERRARRWTVQVSFTSAGMPTKEEDHEVDPDPKSGEFGSAGRSPVRLRFETSADLRGEQERLDLLDWMIEQIRPKRAEEPYRRIF